MKLFANAKPEAIYARTSAAHKNIKAEEYERVMERVA